jgi:hypothetical protein
MKLIQTIELKPGDFIFKNNEILEILLFSNATDSFDGYYTAKYSNKENSYYHGTLMSWCEIPGIKNMKFRLHESFQKIDNEK